MLITIHVDFDGDNLPAFKVLAEAMQWLRACDPRFGKALMTRGWNYSLPGVLFPSCSHRQDSPAQFPLLALHSSGRRYWWAVERSLEDWNSWKQHCVAWYYLDRPEQIADRLTEDSQSACWDKPKEKP